MVHNAHEQVDSAAYFFEVTDRTGVSHPIKAFGVERISRERPFRPDKSLLQEFPEATEVELRRE